MGDKAIGAVIGIVTGVIGITILAVLVSNQSQTGAVITSAGNAFSGILKAAVSPISSGGIGSGLLGGGSSTSLSNVFNGITG
jgi:PRD1 phage membrane DNA delivery